MIQVKENSDTITMPATEMEKPSDIVADKDGVVTEIITRKGVPLVHAGDEVKKGDLLVSGRVEVLNDSKEVIGYQYQTADADIFVQTVCSYEETMERAYEKKIYTEKERRFCWDDKKSVSTRRAADRGVSVDIRRTFCTSGFSWNGEGTRVSSAEETIWKRRGPDDAQ